MPPAFQWARLKADVQCALRKGAWYRILKLTSTEVVLDVRGKPLSVPRGQLQLSSEPALRWSVVPSPKHTARFPATWGASYAVCPNCRDREARGPPRQHALPAVQWVLRDRLERIEPRRGVADGDAGRRVLLGENGERVTRRRRGTRCGGLEHISRARCVDHQIAE